MASVCKSAVPASISSIRELKSTVLVIDFHRVFEGRANIVKFSSCFLSLCHLSFLVSFFPLGCSFTAVFLYFCLSFFPLGCNFTAVFLLAQLVIIHLFFFLSSVLPGA